MYQSGEFLKGIRRADMLIKRKSEEIERMEHLAVYSGIRYGEERGSRTVTDTKAEIVCRIVDLKEEMERQIDGLIDMKLKAMKMIDSLENGDIVDILYQRYFEFRKWEDIAKRKHYSLDWVFRLHREGLRKLEKYFK